MIEWPEGLDDEPWILHSARWPDPHAIYDLDKISECPHIARTE